MRYPGDSGSVHLQDFPTLPDRWRDDALAEKWAKLRKLRRVVTGALEIKRADKSIGSSLQAEAIVYATEDYRRCCDELHMPELFITSEARFEEGDAPGGAFELEEVAGVSVVIRPAAGEKCARCWQVLPEVGSVGEHTDICARCADAVEAHQAAAE